MASEAVKFHPVLFPPSTFPSSVNAVKVAPPDAVELLILQYVSVLVPVLSNIVQLPEDPVLIKDINFPELPFTVKDVTVVVEFGNTIECASEPSSFKSAKVLAPVIVIVAVLLPLENQTLL